MRLDDLAGLKAKLDVADEAPGVGCREAEADVALDALAESCGGRFVTEDGLSRVEVG